METKGKFYKTLVWHGEIKKVECTDHQMAWSGKIPCTGIYSCVLCGYTPLDLEVKHY